MHSLVDGPGNISETIVPLLFKTLASSSRRTKFSRTGKGVIIGFVEKIGEPGYS